MSEMPTAHHFVLYAALIVAAMLTLDCFERRRARVRAPRAGGTMSGPESADPTRSREPSRTACRASAAVLMPEDPHPRSEGRARFPKTLRRE
jgi:hypothetical protein